MMGQIKVWVDDMRPQPCGFVWVRDYYSAILLLASGCVEEISLDHDLGYLVVETGYDIAKWIEKQVATNNFIPPIMHAHSQNPPGREQIEACIEKIGRILGTNEKVT